MTSALRTSLRFLRPEDGTPLSTEKMRTTSSTCKLSNTTMERWRQYHSKCGSSFQIHTVFNRFNNRLWFSTAQVKAEASWDSTVHECPQLSRGGSWPEQRVYLTIRVVVQLSHPADMQLVLRKRICVNVNPGRPGFAQNFLRRMSTRSTIPGCGVTFEVVSNIPGVRASWKSVLFVLHHRFLYFSRCNAVFLLGCTWIRGQGDVGSTRCQRAQQPISWRRGSHREIPPKCHESGEHPDFGQTKTGRWRKRGEKSLCEMIQIK